MQTAAPVDKARCFNCRNLTGIVNLRVTEDGHVVCRRCSERRTTLTGPGGSVEVIG